MNFNKQQEEILYQIRVTEKEIKDLNQQLEELQEEYQLFKKDFFFKLNLLTVDRF